MAKDFDHLEFNHNTSHNSGKIYYIKWRLTISFGFYIQLSVLIGFDKY